MISQEERKEIESSVFEKLLVEALRKNLQGRGLRKYVMNRMKKRVDKKIKERR